jgi:hypothetical protein
MGNEAVRYLARVLAASIVMVLTMFGASPAWAEGARTLVIVIEGGGPNLPTAIAGELGARWTRADAKAVASAAKTRELPDSPTALDSLTTKGPYLLRLGRVASDVGATASVAILVSKGKTREAHVVVVSAAGATRLDTQVTLGAPAEDAATITRAFSVELDALVKPEAPASKPAPTPTPSSEAAKPLAPTASTASTAKDAPSPPPPTGTGSESAPPLLVATATLGAAIRHLSYRDDVTPLHSDDSGVAPSPAIAVEVYPGARSGTVVLQDLGLFGDFDLGLVHDKKLPDGSKASVTWTRFDVGLKYRIWLRHRDWKALMIAPSLSYGAESYSFQDPTPPPVNSLDTPSVGYQILRPRVEGRIPVGPIVVLPGAGYLGILDSGEVASKFRNTTAVGWEADLGVTLPITNALEVRGDIGYRRITYWFSPKAGDLNIANGAHDQIFRAGLGISARL